MERGGYAILLAALLVLPSAGADWLQPGGDAAGGGFASDTPIADDLALRIQLDGVRAAWAQPIVIGRHAYLTTSTEQWPDFRYNERAWGSRDAVWRLDVDTGEVSLFAQGGRWFRGVASDGERIYLAHRDGIVAYDLDGRIVSRFAHEPVRLPNRWWTGCTVPVLGEDLLVVYCEQAESVEQNEDPVNTSTGLVEVHGFVRAFDPHDLSRPLWTWWDTAPEKAPERVGSDGARTTRGDKTYHVSIIGPYVFVALYDAVSSGKPPSASDRDPLARAQERRQGGLLEMAVRGFSLDGRLLWEWQTSWDDKNYRFLVPETAARECGAWPDTPGRVVGTFDEVYLELGDEVLWVDPETGGRLSAQRIREGDTLRNDLSSSPLLHEGTLYVPSAQTLHTFDARSGRPGWRLSLPSSVEERWTGSMLIAGHTLHATTRIGPVACALDAAHFGPLHEAVRPSLPFNQTELWASRLVSLDLDTGATRWEHQFTNGFPVIGGFAPTSYNMALLGGGDGFLVHAMLDGNVTVLGRTGAAPQVALPLNGTHAYPPPGQLVRVDLTGIATPGLGSAVVAHRAEWGDGAVSDWQASPVLTHEYAAPCDCVARFQVRNDLDQTSSEFFTFHVGGAPPAEAVVAAALPPPPTLAEQARETLAGPIGWALLAALVVLIVLLAVVAYVRRRSRLAREIRAVDRAYRATAGDATAALSVLAERRTHASHLLLKRKLTMGEHAKLVAHIADLETTLGPKPPPLPSAIEPGALLLGKYRVVRPLGEGAYGRAYLAEDARVSRQVVLKVLHAQVAEDALREARAIGGIRHPNVITLHDVEQVAEKTVLVMEYADGGSLRDRIARGAVGFDEFHALADGLLRALEAVHEAGAVHRDIKPSNVLLTSKGEVKLADFGIATPAQIERTMSEGPREAVGTLRYMSPEQARGRRVTPRSDLYSAAVTLYEAWTGEALVQPQAGESLVEVQVRVASAAPFTRDVGPRALRDWFAKALAPEPEERFMGAREMREALERARRVVA